MLVLPIPISKLFQRGYAISMDKRHAYGKIRRDKQHEYPGTIMDKQNGYQWRKCGIRHRYQKITMKNAWISARMNISDLHEHAFCVVTSSQQVMSPTHTTGRLRVGWLVRVISESFSGLVLKTCGPINTTRDTNICSPNRRIRALHDHSSPIAVRSTHSMVLCCVSNMLSPSGVVFSAFFGVFRSFWSSTHNSFRYSGTGILSWWSLFWHDWYAIRPFHAVILYSHHRITCSVSPLFCAWLIW